MKRNGHKNKGKMALILAAVMLPIVISLIVSILPPVFTRAAMLSAALTMPEGSIKALEERFKDIIEVQRPNGDESVQAERENNPISGPAWEWPQLPRSSQNNTNNFYIPDESEIVNPEIPEEHKGPRIMEDMSGYEGGPYFKWNNMWLRNYTDYTYDDLSAILETEMKIKLEDTDKPQVLIYHTHATESYCPYEGGQYDKRYNWRSTDNNINMVSIGAQVTQTLRENGIGVIHDTEQHDYPSYDGSYASSHDSIKRYLEEYPTIKVTLDLHRDAIERNGGLIVDPSIEIDGERYAQLMIISNCDDGSGLIPEWRENLRFAAALNDTLEKNNKGITRPILFSHRKYNQQLSTGALLLEFGSHASTVKAAKNTAVLVGEALAELLKSTV